MLKLLLLWTVLASEARNVAELYERVSPAVAGITCRRGLTEHYFGTGTVIDPSGLVITSITVVPADAWQIRVFLRGGEVLGGKVALTNAGKELSLVRIDAPRDHADFPSVKLGDSRVVRVGEPALTLGNAFQSIESDDQVTLGEGLVSGLYRLSETLSESKYTGYAIETTAHLNSGMDGGPLIDARGELIGILCLNYSKSRWLGTAVPIHELKPLIAAERGWLSDRDEGFAVYAGLEIEDVGTIAGSGKGPEGRAADLRVLRVHAGSPASQAGLAEGDRITRAQGVVLDSLKPLRETFASLRPGDTLRLEASRGGAAPETKTVEIRLWGRF